MLLILGVCDELFVVFVRLLCLVLMVIVWWFAVLYVCLLVCLLICLFELGYFEFVLWFCWSFLSCLLLGRLVLLGWGWLA